MKINEDKELNLFLDSCGLPSNRKISKMRYGITNKVYKLEVENKVYLLKEYIGKCNDLCKNKLLQYCKTNNINVPIVIKEEKINNRKFGLFEYIYAKHKFTLNQRELTMLNETISKMSIPVKLSDYSENNILVKIENYIQILTNASDYKISEDLIKELLLKYRILNIQEPEYSFAIIHGDLSCVNMLWKNKELYILDFDESIVAPKEYEAISTIIKLFFHYDDFDLMPALSFLSYYCNENHTSLEKLQKIWDFYILKVIIEKLALYQIGDIDVEDSKQKKDSWEYWYQLLCNDKLKNTLFEIMESLC